MTSKNAKNYIPVMWEAGEKGGGNVAFLDSDGRIAI